MAPYAEDGIDFLYLVELVQNCLDNDLLFVEAMKIVEKYLNSKNVNPNQATYFLLNMDYPMEQNQKQNSLSDEENSNYETEDEYHERTNVEPIKKSISDSEEGSDEEILQIDDEDEIYQN
ncbi:MAG: hypothetical protein Satyrvirus6_20 [Satyrvirus sp.]|uniref:Uncharacterized protein n=1 Tax=Satyrvirus sp. TaxID=2487771 RepID=A0A3G5ADJ0_9VIRU|nr:MAG: hypothetical protein Satyrvirus6_20 [Satyrvirus sp.]